MSSITSTDCLIVGISGKYCAGKDAVCSVFSEHGFAVIDVDKIGHTALQSQSREVISKFGSAVSNPDGSINRRALGHEVFSHADKLVLLESILHPAMVLQVKETVQSRMSERYLINAAILHRMGLHLLCDWIVWVTAPVMQRITRAMNRDGVTFVSAIKRIRAQRKLSLRYLPSDVDSNIVRNRGNLRSLKGVVESLLSSKGIR